MTLRSCRALFVQPHTDDVALACGGLVAQRADAGDAPVVVGVFTGAPPPERMSSPGVVELHASWGLGDEPWRGRREEDARACAVLGAQPLWLDYLDAPYRDGYATFAALFGAMAADDPLIARIAAELEGLWRETPDATLYLPLGIGGHIDHQLCHATGVRLETAGVPVRYYEDFPYAAVSGLVAARLAELGGTWATELVDVGPVIERRIAASEAYVSQVKRLFRTDSIVPGPTDQAIKRHAAALGGGLAGYIARGPRFAEIVYRRGAHAWWT